MNFNNTMAKIGAITAGILVILIIFFSTTLKKIKPGYVGVVYTPSSGVSEKTLTQGWHLVNPIATITSYTVSTEQSYMSSDRREGSESDDSFMIPTSDGKTVRVSLEYSYRFDDAKVTEIFTRFRGRSGDEINRIYMRGKIKSYVAEVTSTFNVIDVYGSRRTELNSFAFKNVRNKFDADGIIIESLNFSEIVLDPQTEKAIQERVNAQQALERQKVEAERAKIEAEKNIIIAEGNAAVAIANAEGQAKSTKIAAEAEAFAILAKQKVITKELIEYEKMLKWNGVLPTFQGGNATPIIDFRTPKSN
ncbi:MAG: prohibitin family protein [Fusobacteriaceae bacterium]